MNGAVHCIATLWCVQTFNLGNCAGPLVIEHIFLEFVNVENTKDFYCRKFVVTQLQHETSRFQTSKSHLPSVSKARTSSFEVLLVTCDTILIMYDDSDLDPFQSRAFRPLPISFSGYSRLLCLSENTTLWCLIQGDCQAFKVAPPLYIDVDDLKRLIHSSIEPTVPPKDLILWKVWAM